MQYILITLKNASSETAEANVLFSFIKESAQAGALPGPVKELTNETINCKHLILFTCTVSFHSAAERIPALCAQRNKTQVQPG